MTGLAVGASPRALVPGDPDDLEALARRLEVLAGGARHAAGGLRSAGAAGWIGAAGDAFRTAVDDVPAQLGTAGASFAAASAALRDYARVLRAAQEDAAHAVRLHEEGVAETRQWQAQVRAYEQETARPSGAAARPRPPSYDPGADEVRRAQGLLATAREDVERAAARAVAVLRGAADDAPREPRWFEKAWRQVREFGKGAWEATAGTVTFLYSVTLQLVVDPEAWASDVADVGRGVVYGVQHPVELGKAVLDWETWQENPARALGRLVPDLIATVATGGAGAAVRGTRGLRSLTRATALQRAGLTPADVPRLTQSQAAQVVARGERFTPRTLRELNRAEPWPTDFAGRGPSQSWKEPPVTHAVVPERLVLTNLHDSGPEPKSHAFWSDPRDLLSVPDEAAALDRFALLDSWYRPGGGDYVPRDEVSIRVFEAGEAQPIQIGRIGPQTAGDVTADPFTGELRRQHAPGGAAQWVSKNPPHLWDVPVSTWQGPPPWEPLFDPGAWRGAVAGTGIGAAAAVGGDVQEQGARP